MLTLTLLASLQAPARPAVPPRPDLPPCSFAGPAQQVDTLAALPAQVRAELLRALAAGGGLAEAGEAFTRTDVVHDRSLPRRRFARAYLTGDTWFVWFEQGGFAYNLTMVALVRPRGAASGYRAVPGSRFTGNLCAASRAFLAGARSTG